MQAIGRLDEDTTGVLLFTDDGQLVHRLTSPKRHVAKVYEVRCKHPVDAARSSGCCAGVLLHDDDATVRAAACEATGERELRLTLTEGKYHQVKRMVAAVGNRVEALERSAFGPMRIDGLAAGAWRWADAASRFPDRSLRRQSRPAGRAPTGPRLDLDDVGRGEQRVVRRVGERARHLEHVERILRRVA